MGKFPVRTERGLLAGALTALLLLVACLAAGPAAAQAQVPPPGSTASENPAAPMVPSFWDPRRRPERPDLTRLTTIRFLTETDYPPFNYAGPDGNPVGFNVDVARLICEEIKISCSIQMRRFDTLLQALGENRGDAVIASLAVTPQNRQRADFSDPYFRPAARFVARRDSPITDVTPEKLEGRKIGVIANTSHEAYLKALFTEAELRPFPNLEASLNALRQGEVDLFFGDAVAIAFWLNGTDSAGCCAFRGGPFVESRYFGEGVGIAVRKGNDQLRQAINWALFRLWERGKFTDLWLRYFPVSPL